MTMVDTYEARHEMTLALCDRKTPYFAMATNVCVAVATDDLFPKKKHDLDPYDVGIRLGLWIYVK